MSANSKQRTQPSVQHRRDAVIPVLDDQLCFALYTASHQLVRAYRPLLEPLGLTYVQYLVMLVLWEYAPRSVGDLGERLNLDSGTLTPLLKRMEAAGHVSRQRDPDDERRVQIDLTRSGRTLADKAASVSDHLLCQSELTRPESHELRDRIMALTETLKNADRRPGRSQR